MDDTCWICGYKLKKQDYEDIVYTKGGIAHALCADEYQEEVPDDFESGLRISQ